MQVLGKDKIVDFMRKQNQASGPLKAWLNEAENAEWSTSQDIKDRYSTASFLSHDVVIFNMGGNKYRLEVVVRYANRCVLILFVGTHSEYNKRNQRKKKRKN